MASTSQNLPSLNELSVILSHISPNDYETCFKVMIACGRAYNQDPAIFAIVQNWAKGYLYRDAQCEEQEKAAFFNSSKRHDGVNLGWLIHNAKSGGYVPKNEFNNFAQSVVIGEVKRPLNVLITSKVESLIKGPDSPEKECANALLETVNAVLTFWVFVSKSFAVERVQFLKENVKAFDCLVPGAASLYFKALTSYCDYLKDPNLFYYEKFIEWGVKNIDGFDAGELNSFGASKEFITTPAEAIDKFSYAMQDSAMLVTYEKLQQIAKQCSKFCQISPKDKEEKDAIKTKIQRDINQLGTTITLGDSLLQNVLGEDVAPIAKELSLTTLNPDTSNKVYIKTGIDQLDKHIHGYRRGATTILAAHSGVGKTWFGVDASRNVLEQGGRVIFFSSEMASEEICLRFVNNVSNISDDTLKTFYERCAKGVNNHNTAIDDCGDDYGKVFYNVDLYFHEHPNLSIIAGKNGGLSVDQIVDTIALQSQSGPLDLVVVDYLQNLDNESFNPRAANWERIKDTMERLNNACRLYHCPMLILAQLNKPIRKPSGAAAEPDMYDVAQASAVVRDAAAVLLLYKVKDYDSPDQAIDSNGVVNADFKAMSTNLRLSIGKSRFGHQSTEPLFLLREEGSRFTAL